jgi:hypothetical protein
MSNQLTPRTVEEMTLYEEGQILRLEIRDPHGERHFLELNEKTFNVHENYKVIGQCITLSLSHIFDTIYGVSSITGMDPQTAMKVGMAMCEWSRKHGYSE